MNISVQRLSFGKNIPLNRIVIVSEDCCSHLFSNPSSSHILSNHEIPSFFFVSLGFFFVFFFPD